MPALTRLPLPAATEPLNSAAAYQRYFDSLPTRFDVGITVPLGPDRSLWLSGDTLDLTKTGLAAFVARNNVILQEGRAFTWLVPPAKNMPTTTGAGWLWPVGGIALGGTVQLIWQRLEQTGAPTDMWGFKVVGHELHILDAALTTVAPFPLPDTLGTDIQWNGSPTLRDGWVHLMGWRKTGWMSGHQVQRRWRVDDLAQQHTWNGTSWQPTQTTTPGPVPVWSGGPQHGLQLACLDGRLVGSAKQLDTTGRDLTTWTVSPLDPHGWVPERPTLTLPPLPAGGWFSYTARLDVLPCMTRPVVVESWNAPSGDPRSYGLHLWEVPA